MDPVIANAGLEGTALDARKPPPEYLKSIFKQSRNYSAKDVPLDLTSWDEETSDLHNQKPFKEFLKTYHESWILEESEHEVCAETTVYKSKVIPGLMLLRNYLPANVQRLLVLRLLGSEFKDPEHRTNLHAHYSIVYPKNEQTFFDLGKQEVAFKAKLPIHKDLTMEQVFQRKLRWILLGGQYDWDEKKYPETTPATFPPDIGELIRGMFPSMVPQAAIVNLYSPGDTLSLHRDVSEKVNRPLVSISLGCDALFIIGNEEWESSHSVVLHSGDVVYMADEARYAWHGVARIIAGTSPGYLQSLNGAGHWKGIMEDKRINLNIRQMF